MDGKNTSTCIGIGIAIGSAIGVLTDNLQLWLPLGIVIGGGLAARFGKAKSDDSNEE